MADLNEEIIYDGVSCKNFGYVVCYFDSKNGFEKRLSTANKVYNKIKTNASNEFNITNKKYEEPYKFTIQLCKQTGESIVGNEQELLSNWLDVDDYRPFQFCNVELSDVVFFAVCVNKQRIFLDDQYGWELEFECNAPYGFSLDEVIATINTSSEKSINIIDLSSVKSEIYPKLEIDITSDGTFTIENEMTNKTVTFNNCTSGEKIVMNKNNILTSSTRDSDIFSSDNFNYNWFSIGYKNDDTRDNKINFSGTATANVTITFRYNKSVGEY